MDKFDPNLNTEALTLICYRIRNTIMYISNNREVKESQVYKICVVRHTSLHPQAQIQHTSVGSQC